MEKPVLKNYLRLHVESPSGLVKEGKSNVFQFNGDVMVTQNVQIILMKLAVQNVGLDVSNVQLEDA